LLEELGIDLPEFCEDMRGQRRGRFAEMDISHEDILAMLEEHGISIEAIGERFNRAEWAERFPDMEISREEMMALREQFRDNPEMANELRYRAERFAENIDCGELAEKFQYRMQRRIGQ
jgi:uncharacterized protein YceH (UPF0502 family)